ncbi:isochorismatase family protein [Phyllobacterium myrsinacearum]|uniref:Nicotinamidase-related amidase n=1 Tax=Phyllobacterium myrsinacearum TaxID=28101 RepID=A0A839EIR3_9HYPH|nr:isochorismatase family protein [Phyllobacterium myrsinacearum]MBA8876387.1 nicotinamidase-related amidase [Phyllobacterium myrsinacearum]
MTFTGEDKTAHVLVIVDVQNAFITGSEAVPDHVQLQRAVEILLANARAAKVPVIFLQNDGPAGTADEPNTDGWQLFFALKPGEHVVRKSRDDGFDGTELEALLTGYGLRSLAICGMQSEMCLAATARTAMQKGFSVILPHDAHATYDVPAGPGGSEPVPARMAARAAEWSLGDEIIVVGTAADVCFQTASAA